MDSLVRERVEWLTAAPVSVSRELTGGFTTSSTWSVELTDGRHVFVKFAPDDESITANRNEADVLVMAGGSLAPELIGITDDGRVLVTEDLSGADWTTRRFDDDFWEAVAAVGTLEAPAGLFQTYQGAGREWWSRVAYDEHFASTVGLGPNWLACAASALTAARSRRTRPGPVCCTVILDRATGVSSQSVAGGSWTGQRPTEATRSLTTRLPPSESRV